LLGGKRKRINKLDSKVAEYFEFCMFFFFHQYLVFYYIFFQMLKTEEAGLLR